MMNSGYKFPKEPTGLPAIERVTVSIVLSLASADISGGTGNLIVNLWFRTWDGI